MHFSFIHFSRSMISKLKCIVT